MIQEIKSKIFQLNVPIVACTKNVVSVVHQYVMYLFLNVLNWTVKQSIHYIDKGVDFIDPKRGFIRKCQYLEECNKEIIIPEIVPFLSKEKLTFERTISRLIVNNSGKALEEKLYPFITREMYSKKNVEVINFLIEIDQDKLDQDELKKTFNDLKDILNTEKKESDQLKMMRSINKIPSSVRSQVVRELKDYINDLTIHQKISTFQDVLEWSKEEFNKVSLISQKLNNIKFKDKSDKLNLIIFLIKLGVQDEYICFCIDIIEGMKDVNLKLQNVKNFFSRLNDYVKKAESISVSFIKEKTLEFINYHQALSVQTCHVLELIQCMLHLDEDTVIDCMRNAQSLDGKVQQMDDKPKIIDCLSKISKELRPRVCNFLNNLPYLTGGHPILILTLISQFDSKIGTQQEKVEALENVVGKLKTQTDSIRIFTDVQSVLYSPTECK